jgi:tetratricopeptide (TPR) repeat protein
MEWMSLVISLTALAIAAYGIVERRRAVDRELRSQFASMIRELHALPEVYPDPATAAAGQFRRALLTQQATALESMVDPRRLTSEEYGTVAHALDTLGETQRAIGYWEKAVERAGDTPGVMQAAPWRGYAWCCFEERRLPEARNALRRSLSLLPRDHDRNRYDIVYTCADWVNMERRLPGDLGQPEEPMAYAREVLAEVDDPDMLREMEGLLGLQPPDPQPPEADGTAV